jgi:Xaa-Pro aminopeptidase
MAQMDITGRLARLRARLQAEGVDALIITRSTNVDYITGIDHIHDDEDPHAALVSATEARLVTDSRYLEAAANQAGVWDVFSAEEDSVPTDLAKLFDLSNYATIALESSIAYGTFTALADSFAPSKTVAAKGWIEDLRRTKDAGEIERIAAAQAITDAAFTHIRGFIRVGQTEKEIAVELEYTLRKLGADGLAFPSIVAAGANGSLPHHVPSDTKVASGNLVILDFGAAYQGYCSDMTRTVAVGEPSKEARQVFETVLAAQQVDLAVIAAGVTGVDADKPGRDIIATAGYGDFFGHGTSHGVGLDIHESPSASPRSKDTLQAGDIISCEPGIYLPKKLGVRIEDLVAVEAGGMRNFTASPKELIIL